MIQTALLGPGLFGCLFFSLFRRAQQLPFASCKLALLPSQRPEIALLSSRRGRSPRLSRPRLGRVLSKSFLPPRALNMPALGMKRTCQAA